jgi:acetyl esterase
MPLEPQSQHLMDVADAAGLPPLYTLSVEQARSMAEIEFADAGAGIPPIRTEDRMIPSEGGLMRCRIFYPDGKGPFPILVYCHGGGWVLGGIESCDSFCKLLAALAGVVVVSADYRLSPESKYPDAVNDAYAAVLWAHENAASFDGDASRLAVGGDSAGANLVAAACLSAKEKQCPPIRYQLLIYPVLDYYLPGTRSYRDNASGYFLTREHMAWFWGHYLREGEDIDNPHICPLRASDLSNLPDAHILTAEFDPLRDEGEAYAQKLRDFGVNVRLDRFEGVMHGFVMQWQTLDKGLEAIRLISENLKTRYCSPI